MFALGALLPAVAASAPVHATFRPGYHTGTHNVHIREQKWCVRVVLRELWWKKPSSCASRMAVSPMFPGTLSTAA